MEQVKTKRVKKESPKFDPESINWGKHKKKLLDIRTYVQVAIPSKFVSAEEIKSQMVAALDKAIQTGIDHMSIGGEISGLSVNYYYGQLAFSAKREESSSQFETRVIQEERTKWLAKQNEEATKKKEKEQDMKTFERIKAKYKL